MPPAYLAKHLQALAQAGIVESVAGRKGGYRLRRPAGEITLLEVVDAVEGTGPGLPVHRDPPPWPRPGRGCRVPRAVRDPRRDAARGERVASGARTPDDRRPAAPPVGQRQPGGRTEVRELVPGGSLDEGVRDRRNRRDRPLRGPRARRRRPRGDRARARATRRPHGSRGKGARPRQVSLFDVDALTAAFAGPRRGRQPGDRDPADQGRAEGLRVGDEHSDPHRRIDGSRRCRAGRRGSEAHPGVDQLHVRGRRRHDGWTRANRSTRRPASTRWPWPRANANRFTDAGSYRDRAAIRLLLRGRERAHRGVRSVSPAATSVRSPARRSAYQSSIHLADAAAAVVAALDAPAGIYNVVDDEPLIEEGVRQGGRRAVGREASVDRPPGPLRPCGRQEVRRADPLASRQQREVQGGDRLVAALSVRPRGLAAQWRRVDA